MSQPSTPRTAIPIITTEVHSSSPSYTVHHLDDGSVQYRIEERRRTIYVTANTQRQLSTQTMDELLKLTKMPESGPEQPRRTRSLELGAAVNQLGLSPSSPNRLRVSTAGAGPRSPVARRAASTRGSSPVTPISQFWTPVSRPRILFYHKHDPHYGFTNFSPHPVMYKGKKYPTSEHLFQSFKFQEHRPGLAEHIRTCSEWPSMAFSEARRFQPEVRHDWKDVNIQKMDEALWHKFTQHRDLREELLATHDAELVEDSDKDAFWGVGADGMGRNELGKALERLRTKLREQSAT